MGKVIVMDLARSAFVRTIGISCASYYYRPLGMRNFVVTSTIQGIGRGEFRSSEVLHDSLIRYLKMA
jgi:hypothetical protein